MSSLVFLFKFKPVKWHLQVHVNLPMQGIMSRVVARRSETFWFA